MKEKILEIKNLAAGYENIIVKNISFDVFKNSNLAIVGSSGSGKTTLVNAMTYFAKIFVGNIILNNKDITFPLNKDLKEIRSKLQLISQNTKTSFNEKHSISKYIEEPIINFRNLTKKKEKN